MVPGTRHWLYIVVSINSIHRAISEYPIGLWEQMTFDHGLFDQKWMQNTLIHTLSWFWVPGIGLGPLYFIHNTIIIIDCIRPTYLFKVHYTLWISGLRLQLTRIGNDKFYQFIIIVLITSLYTIVTGNTNTTMQMSKFNFNIFTRILLYLVYYELPLMNKSTVWLWWLAIEMHISG